MSRLVNTRPNDWCPEHCRFMELSVDTRELIADNKLAYIENIVSCTNEHVCEMWYEIVKENE